MHSQTLKEILTLTELFLLRHAKKSYIPVSQQLHAQLSSTVSSTTSSIASITRDSSKTLQKNAILKKNPSSQIVEAKPTSSKLSSAFLSPLVQEKLLLDHPQKISLEPLLSGSATCLSSQKKAEFEVFFKKNFPKYLLCDAILTDTLARNVKKKWEKPKETLIFFFTLSSDLKTLHFFKNIAHAINVVLNPIELYVKHEIHPSDWQKLLDFSPLFIMMTKEELLADASLLAHYHQTAASAHFLKNTPLFLLPDPYLYFKNPYLKAELWEDLTRFFFEIKNIT